MKYKKRQKSHIHIYPKFACNSRRAFKTKTKITIAFVAVLSIASGIEASSFVIRQSMAAPCSASPCSTTFQVNVVESLSVTVTTPENWATGNINTFLRNEVGLEVSTNNVSGFTASMYANTGSSDSTNTSLTNTAKSDALLPTMSESQVKSAFSANQWGYSLNTTDTAQSKTYNNNIYNETAAGNDSSNYYPLPTSSAPATVLTGDAGSATRMIYFGAKADAATAAGTYAGNVVIGVVSGVKNNNNDPTHPVEPVVPSGNPVNPDNPPSGATNPYYDSTNNRTVYTNTTADPTTSTTSQSTQISTGDTRSSYSNPAGVTENTMANINSGTPLAAGLAVTAAVAATSGAIFFILAKRKKDDDEEENDEVQ